jgi:hypothetical protein
MPGAVGLWLWAQVSGLRSGSISVWSEAADLRRFVALPLHVEIMRRFRTRGAVRATTWTAESFDRAATLTAARRWLDA